MREGGDKIKYRPNTRLRNIPRICIHLHSFTSLLSLSLYLPLSQLSFPLSHLSLSVYLPPSLSLSLYLSIYAPHTSRRLDGPNWDWM